MFKEIVEKELYCFHEGFDKWEDSILACTKPLIEKKVIDQRYVDKIFESIDKYGPYIVLAPDVAMPHSTENCHAAQGLGGVQRVAADLAGKLHVFQRGQVLHQVVELEHKAHVIPAVGGQLPGGKAAHVAAVQPDVALVAVVHAAQNIQQGGLARTGGPHDDAELALVHIEIQVVGGSDLHTAGLVIFTDIFKLHKMLHGVFPFCQNAKYFNLNIA